ncbi:uncharacterized protein LOC112689780 [Sipha flava]|uniref:Uncharacterized protein LOC112689780 n=3 Tax=Sipha flava TaxID=143950 RepID=A0A8B8G9B8_9HEMI|nr:uncharacterized protein LOC112689780 [Sipha flava]
MSKKANYHACIFCLKSINLNPGLSLHVFPKDPVIRSKWLKIFGLNESDIYPNRKVCSLHFEEHCFSGQYRKFLKTGSIPTLYTKKEYFVPANPSTSGMSSDLITNLPNTSMDIPVINSDEVIQRSLKRVHHQTSEYTVMSETSTFAVLIKSDDIQGDIKTLVRANPKKAKIQFMTTECQIMIQRRETIVINETVSGLQ